MELYEVHAERYRLFLFLQAHLILNHTSWTTKKQSSKQKKKEKKLLHVQH